MIDRATKNRKWLELSATVGAEDVGALTQLFDKYGYGGAIVEEWPDDSGKSKYILKTYFSGHLNVKKSKLLKILESSCLKINLEERSLEPGEWLKEWKKYFEPFEMGKKIIIKPGWKTDSTEANGRQIVELDPGMAFGTGLHATTRLAYLGLEKYLTAGVSVLDLGTGSGILAIAAAKLGAASVLAMDTDPVAVAAAILNASKNNVQATVEVKKGTLNATGSRKLNGRFDLVIANITADVIAGLAPHFKKVLKPGGRVITSGINDRGLDKVLVALAMTGLKLEAIKSEGEWHSVVAVVP